METATKKKKMNVIWVLKFWISIIFFTIHFILTVYLLASSSYTKNVIWIPNDFKVFRHSTFTVPCQFLLTVNLSIQIIFFFYSPFFGFFFSFSFFLVGSPDSPLGIVLNQHKRCISHQNILLENIGRNNKIKCKKAFNDEEGSIDRPLNETLV